MNDEMRNLLRMMADGDGVSVDTMLEKVIREAASWRGFLDEPARLWTGGR